MSMTVKSDDEFIWEAMLALAPAAGLHLKKPEGDMEELTGKAAEIFGQAAVLYEVFLQGMEQSGDGGDEEELEKPSEPQYVVALPVTHPGTMDFPAQVKES